MSKRLVSLLLSLLLIVGVAYVPAGAAPAAPGTSLAAAGDGDTDDTDDTDDTPAPTLPPIVHIVIALNENEGQFVSNASKQDNYWESSSSPFFYYHDNFPPENRNGEILSRQGYKFDGWWTDRIGGKEVKPGDYSEIDRSQITQDGSLYITLYAHWKPETRSVTLDPNGGNFNKNQKPITVEVPMDGTYESVISGTGNTPQRPGYDFEYWYQSTGEGNDAVDQKTKFDLDIFPDSQEPLTLKAKWKQKSFKITFDPNSPDSDVELDTEEFPIQYGKEYSTLQPGEPSCKGYEFKGWYTERDGTGDSFTELSDDGFTYSLTTDQTFYARWDAARYTKDNLTLSVTLSADGATTTVNLANSSIRLIYGETINTGLPRPDSNVKPKFANDDTDKTYSFEGWYTTEKDELAYDGEPDPDRTGEKLERDVDCPALDYDDALGTYMLYARWSYKVQFYAEGAEGAKEDGPYATADAITYTAYSQANDTYERPDAHWPNAPVKYGYDFLGWLDHEPGPNTQGNDEHIGLSSIADPAKKKLYADFQPKDIYVTLNAGEGTLPNNRNTITAAFDKAYGTLPEPTRFGYDFVEWVDNSGKPVTSETIVKNENPHTLTAIWAAREVTLKLVYAPASDKIDELEFDYATTFQNIDLPTRLDNINGYEFVGWYTTEDDSTTRGVNVSTNPNTKPDVKEVNGQLTVTLYARWKYTVSFYANIPDDPTSLSTPCYTRTLTTGTAYGDSLPNRPDYQKQAFLGWFPAETGGKQVGKDDIATGEYQKLYAHWGGTNDCTITLNVNGATGPASFPKSLSIKYGKTYSELFMLDPLVRTGYEFQGWFTDKDEGTEITAESEVNGDITLYARWKAKDVELTVFDPTNQLQETLSVPYGTYLLNFLNGIEKDLFQNGGAGEDGEGQGEDASYVLVGWYYNSTFSNRVQGSDQVGNTNGKINSTDPISVYGNWIKNETITLDPQGGSLTTGEDAGAIEAYIGGNYPELPRAIRPGYYFSGWFTTKEGGFEAREGSLVWTNNDQIISTLYAHWEAKKVHVTYDYTDGPVGLTTSDDLPYGSTYSSLPRVPVWDGHEFIGWFTAPVLPTVPAGPDEPGVPDDPDGSDVPNGGTQVKAGDPVIPDDLNADALTATLYAHWGFKVQFLPGKDGKGKMDGDTVVLNQPYTVPECTFEAPDGKCFDHWYIRNDSNDIVYPGDSIENCTSRLWLTAVWVDIPLTITATCTTGGSITTTDGEELEDGSSSANPDGDTSFTIKVTRGENVTFTIRPYLGYELKELIVDGEHYPGPFDTYTFKKVNRNHSIQAVFQWPSLPAYVTCARDSSCPMAKFGDLDPNTWYHDAVHYCLDYAVMNGRSSTSYAPNAIIGRAEVTQAVWNADRWSADPIGSAGLVRQYSDISAKDWFYTAVVWGTDRGIVTGAGDGTFQPNRSITREELATILWRYAGSPPASRYTMNTFDDSNEVSGYAVDAMAWATENDIIYGRSSCILAPKGNATRAEVATMLQRFFSDAS